MTISDLVTIEIIKKLLKGEDYRIEIVNLIDGSFLDHALVFLREINQKKSQIIDTDLDWYLHKFIKEKTDSEEIATNAGLNKKTITNMHNTAKKGVVIEAAELHFSSLTKYIQMLIDAQPDSDLTLTIKSGDTSVDLNFIETLVVINALAVKRAAIRGGYWSSAGKQVEKPLILSLCKLYQVPEENFTFVDIAADKSMRDIDFYLVKGDKRFNGEVKLMGKGNPESADATSARDTNIFVADKLSDLNKASLADKNIEWVELRDGKGIKQFGDFLAKYDIPHQDLPADIDTKLASILAEIFNLS